MVRHARGMRRVLFGVLIRLIGSHLRRNVIADALRHAITITKQRPELLIETLDDVAQPVQLGLRYVPPPSPGTGSISASSSANAIFSAAFFSTR